MLSNLRKTRLLLTGSLPFSENVRGGPGGSGGTPRGTLIILAVVLGVLTVLLIGGITVAVLPGGFNNLPHNIPGTTPTSVPTANTNVLTLITNTTVPALRIEADIPPMQVNHQVLIAVAIYPTGAPMSVSDVQAVENATPVVTNATPVGTPGSTLVNAFGPNHTVFATATLETSPTIFSVSSPVSQMKPLDQYEVQWRWFVTPLLAGKQVIGVDIEAQWTSTSTGKQGSSYTLGFPTFPVSVQALPVEPTPTPTSQTQTNDNSGTVTTIVVAFIGLFGTILAALIAVPGFRRWVGGLFGRASHPE